MAKTLSEMVNDRSKGFGVGMSYTLDPVGTMINLFEKKENKTSTIHNHLRKSCTPGKTLVNKLEWNFNRVLGASVGVGLYLINPIAAIAPIAVTGTYAIWNLVKRLYTNRKAKDAGRAEDSPRRGAEPASETAGKRPTGRKETILGDPKPEDDSDEVREYVAAVLAKHEDDRLKKYEGAMAAEAKEAASNSDNRSGSGSNKYEGFTKAQIRLQKRRDRISTDKGEDEAREIQCVRKKYWADQNAKPGDKEGSNNPYEGFTKAQIKLQKKRDRIPKDRGENQALKIEGVREQYRGKHNARIEERTKAKQRWEANQERKKELQEARKRRGDEAIGQRYADHIDLKTEREEKEKEIAMREAKQRTSINLKMEAVSLMKDYDIYALLDEGGASSLGKPILLGIGETKEYPDRTRDLEDPEIAKFMNEIYTRREDARQAYFTKLGLDVPEKPLVRHYDAEASGIPYREKEEGKGVRATIETDYEFTQSVNKLWNIDPDPDTFTERLEKADLRMTPNGTPYLRTDESPYWANEWEKVTPAERDKVKEWFDYSVLSDSLETPAST
jgi:hypothetical protein